MSPSESGTAMEGRPSARNSIARQRTPSSEKKTGSLAAGSRSQRRADLPTGRHGGLRAADPTSGGAGAGILVDKAAPPRVSRQRRAGVALPHLCGGRPARAAALDGADAVHDQDHETVCCRRPYAACALPEGDQPHSSGQAFDIQHCSCSPGRLAVSGVGCLGACSCSSRWSLSSRAAP